MGRNKNGHRPTQKEKTLRAFGAYLELLDTAAWLKSWMHGPLASVDLTMQGFRVLMLVYRDGPTPMVEAAKQMRFPRQNLEFVLGRLERHGWVSRDVVRMPGGEPRKPEQKNVRRIGLRPAWQMGVIRLTPLGEKFVGEVFPNHAKVVKALMRALDGREQETLSEICRKLRAGHILKFMSEITHQDEWEEDVPETREAGDAQDEEESEEDKLSRLLRRGAKAAEDPKEAVVRAFKPGDRERLLGIAKTMQCDDILRYAKNVHWNEPPDRERDSETAVEILMRTADESGRNLLERMTRVMRPPEIIEFLQGMSGPVTTGNDSSD